MDRILYWAAPVWEVALAFAIGGLVLARLLRLALARPRAPEALASLDPSLADAPLFFFEPVKGVQPLSAAAVDLLGQGKLDEDQERRLIAALLEAFERGQPALQPAWPRPGTALQLIAIGASDTMPRGVLAVVVGEAVPSSTAVVSFGPDGVAERPLALGASPIPPRSAAAASGRVPPALEPSVAGLPAPEAARDGQWQVLGPDLRLHRQRPVVEVRRHVSLHAARDGSSDPELEWRSSQLSYTEEALLRLLVSRPGDVQDPRVLFQAAWPSEPVSRHGLHADQRDRLRRLVFQLRQRIEPEPANPRYVGTAHGVGYVFYLSHEPA